MDGYGIEELYYLYRQGSQEAQTSLIEYCYRLIKLMIPAYYYTNKIYQDDLDDFVQTIMIRCFIALECYRPDKGMQVKSFISLVIQNAISSILVKNQGKIVKERNVVYSLEDCLSKESKLHYFDILQDEQTPATIVDEKQQVEQLDEYIIANCSPLEQKIITYHRQGLKDRMIARILNKDVRSVYNANYRIQKDGRFKII